MEVFTSSVLPRRLREPAVAIGNFDGVHVGHARLIELAISGARARGGESVVLTFHPHPAKVLAPALAPPLIATPARKLELLASHGLDVCVVEPFTPALAAQSAESFVDDVLVGRLDAREVVVGYNFTYGQKRRGTVDTLVAAGRQHGFQVQVVPPVTLDGLVASSTKVREFILGGNVDGAAVLLGRPFDVDGTVVRGAGRGRQIGIPTANVRIDGELLPRPGVYAGRVVEGGASHPAAINLGTNPTFTTGDVLSLEAHVLSYDGDLYDRRLRVEFHHRLRAEERFASVGELVAQIHRDIAATRAHFQGKGE